MVVGGGASAFDLLDLALEYGAARICWIYRSPKWMTPSAKPKRFASNVRNLARMQMLGLSPQEMSKTIDADLRRRYRKFGVADLLPDATFDIQHDQLIPGRWRMIGNLGDLERYRDGPVEINRRSILLKAGQKIEADILLWATGFNMDLAHLGSIGLDGIRHPNQMAARCGSMVLSLDAANLYFMSVGWTQPARRRGTMLIWPGALFPICAGPRALAETPFCTT